MIFGFLRKRRKKEELDRSFERVMEEIHRIDDWDNPKRLRHYILDLCKQIVDRTKELDEQEAQYHVLSDYLMDIRKLGSLNQKQNKALQKVVHNLTTAEQARKDYENVRHKLSEPQFRIMETNQRFVPDEVKQMAANEDDRYKMKRELHDLEVAKNAMEIERERNIYTRETLRKMSIMLLGACASLALLFMMIQMSSGIDMTWGTLLIFLVMALFLMFIFYRNTWLRRENRETVSLLNQTISMLNVMRMKFASLTAAIEFMQRKYGIKTSYELKAMWDFYLEEKRIREKNLQDNEDYKYYSKRLVKILGDLELHDPTMWEDQIEALINQDEMQKVKNSLISARETLRSRMRENRNMIKDERDEISQVMREHDYYPPDIIEMVATVDKRCGLNLNYHFKKEF